MSVASQRAQHAHCPSGCGSVFLEYTGKDILLHVDAFIASVANWPNPTCCPRCFLILVYELSGSCSPECRMLNILKTQRHEFWMSCLHLIVQLTEVHIPSFRQRLIANQCQCPRRTLHEHADMGVDTDMDVFDGFLDALSSALICGLTEGKRPLQPRDDSDGAKYFHKRGGHWPVNPQQLFPSGVERTVDALVHWCCAPVTSAHLALLSTFLTVARALVIPRLLGSPTRDRLAWALVHVLTPPNIAVFWPSSPPPFSPPPSAALRGNAHMVRAALHFLTLLRDDFNARADEVTRFLAGFEPQFLVALQGADEPIAQDYISLLQGGGSGEGEADVVLTIHEYLLRRKASRLCANAACGASELNALSGTPRLFQQCGNCKLARYCSRACQQHDWRLTHRTVCPILCRLLRVADPFLEAADFRRAFEGCALDARDVDVLRRCALASGLMPQVRYGNGGGV